MDEAGRALLAEDLRSPCTEEIAVFRAFAREVGQGTVVLDTAPTGHTLLLFDASEAYRRELEWRARCTHLVEVMQLSERPRSALHRHPAGHTPGGHAGSRSSGFAGDLRRAHIEPFDWVINQSLLDSGSCDPPLQRREGSEHR